MQLNRYYWRILLILWAGGLLFAHPAYSNATPKKSVPPKGKTTSKMPFPEFTATYRGQANGMSFNKLGTRSLKKIGENQYALQYQAKALVYSVETNSTFAWHDNAPKPLTFYSKKGSFFNSYETRYDFQWDKQLVRYTHKNKKGQLPLKPGLQGPLTSMLVLAQALPEGLKEFHLQEINKNKIKNRQFTLLDTPNIKTSNAGTIPTYHLKRLHEDKKRETEVWIHKKYPFIPVKIHQNSNGNIFVLELTEFNINPQ